MLFPTQFKQEIVEIQLAFVKHVLHAEVVTNEAPAQTDAHDEFKHSPFNKLLVHCFNQIVCSFVVSTSLSTGAKIIQLIGFVFFVPTIMFFFAFCLINTVL